MGNVSISSTTGATVSETPDLDDIPDMEEEDLEEGEDEATAVPKAIASGGVIDARRVSCLLFITQPALSPTLCSDLSLSQIEVAKGNLLQVRTYDVMITYDKYYQTPRIWLIGYDEVDHILSCRIGRGHWLTYLWHRRIAPLSRRLRSSRMSPLITHSRQ